MLRKRDAAKLQAMLLRKRTSLKDMVFVASLDLATAAARGLVTTRAIHGTLASRLQSSDDVRPKIFWLLPLLLLGCAARREYFQPTERAVGTSPTGEPEAV
ncbi:MAG: hypothetical protein HY698_11415 [Deltaproteobacteria bacterium]|nr:hypothetical protein [Deltaproteobacteria bacterium]